MVPGSSITVPIVAAIVFVIGQAPTRDSSRLFVATGIAKTVSRAALTLETDEGDRTFTINPSTQMFGRGLASDGVLRDRKLLVTDVVKVGDRVTVTFREARNRRIAAAVHLRVVGQSGR